MSLFSTVDPGAFLKEVLQHVQEELRIRGIHIKMDRRTPLPMVRLNLREFRNALEKIIDFFPILIPKGGELEIEAGIKDIGGEQYVEVEIASSPTFFDVFRPFLQAETHQVGIDIALARHILRRYGDSILFRKENPQRVAFSVLLKAH